ncbi:hypothetical protein DFH08DRAFT_695731 [Mycena albidolilacea]|uniref:BTB domain-containing protein n=1 Tax=Mycena albidolilacea TaxID=1033008 RepID=A0AAD7EU82_9AGAR|nr:hypothetical protein DFH08DRAFT_695731 [Mycena albidolilacea]
MPSPPTKHQHIENTSITRSKVWYKDGSIVMQAESTQFRIHWGVLSQHSNFFADLEGLPQPNDQPTVDRCHIIELQDPVVDVKYLLKALYNPSFLSQPVLSLSAIGTLLRLGHKYDVKIVVDSAVAHIAFKNPTTLFEFDTLTNALVDRKYAPTHILAGSGFYFNLITLVQEHNIVSTLPIVQSCAAHILDGIQREDNTLASLPLVDMRRCLIGRKRLLVKQVQPGSTLGWI